MKDLHSAPSTGGLIVIGTLGALLLLCPAVAQSTIPTYVQGAAFSTAPTSAATVTLTRPVAQGDLLVGWFSEYDAPEQIQVSDNVNGAWTRAPGSLTFLDDTGDIALYYRENSRAAPGGLTITLSVSSAVYWQGAVAEYSGVALAGALDAIATRRFPDGAAVDTGATAAVHAGELVFAPLLTSPGPGSVRPGSSVGVPYTPRAQTADGSAYAQDITSSAAGGQHGTATLSSATDWYAVCAVFHPYPPTPPVPPSTPTGLEATSVASTRVTLSWSSSTTGSVAGYTVYRGGSAIGTTRPDTTVFVDEDVTPSATYAYSVDAFDLVNDHSAPSAPLTVTTPTVSPEFVQGAAASAFRVPLSYTLTLSEPVQAGDLLVGWFGQYGAPGQVHVRDNFNGLWTRSVSTTWGGSGDIALFYRENSAPAPSGLWVTVWADAPADLQEVLADFRHVATAGALDQAVVSGGAGTYATVGPTASVPAGELVVAAVLTGGQPVAATPGSSQMVPYVLDVRNGSASSDLEDILSSASGPQEGSLTIGMAMNWEMVLATFRPAVPTSTSSTTTTSATITSTTTTSTSSTTTTTGPATTTTATTASSSTTTTTLAGDACGRATVIPAAGGTFTGTTSGTSTLAGSCANSGAAPEQVFQWTPTASGTATIQTCGAGTSYDTVLYVRAQTCASGAEIACNDDACANSSGLFRASRVDPTVTAGMTYFIVVDGYGGAQGSFALTVTPPGASTTTVSTTTSTSATSGPTTTTSPRSTTTTTLAGACNAVTVIPPSGGTFDGTTSGGSTLTGSCGNATGPEQVYQWTPSTSGVATIQTCGSGTTYDSVLYVRSPTCTGAEVANGCNDDACPNASGLVRASKVTPTVTAGQPYFIVVDGYGGASGSFTLSVTPP